MPTVVLVENGKRVAHAFRRDAEDYVRALDLRDQAVKDGTFAGWLPAVHRAEDMPQEPRR